MTRSTRGDFSEGHRRTQERGAKSRRRFLLEVASGGACLTSLGSLVLISESQAKPPPPKPPPPKAQAVAVKQTVIVKDSQSGKGVPNVLVAVTDGLQCSRPIVTNNLGQAVFSTNAIQTIQTRSKVYGDYLVSLNLSAATYTISLQALPQKPANTVIAKTSVKRKQALALLPQFGTVQTVGSFSLNTIGAALEKYGAATTIACIYLSPETFGTDVVPCAIAGVGFSLAGTAVYLAKLFGVPPDKKFNFNLLKTDYPTLIML